MHEVTLYTHDGREVTKVMTPPFRIPADVLVWGERFFIYREDGKYREGMAFWVPRKTMDEGFDSRRPLAPKEISGAGK